MIHPYIDKYEYRALWSEEDEAYVCKVAEFPSLGTDGESHSEAIEEMKSLLAFVISDMEAGGESVPEPLALKSYSGKFNVRLPISLHRELAQTALRQGVSLNQLVLRKLSR